MIVNATSFIIMTITIIFKKMFGTEIELGYDKRAFFFHKTLDIKFILKTVVSNFSIVFLRIQPYLEILLLTAFNSNSDSVYIFDLNILQNMLLFAPIYAL